MIPTNPNEVYEKDWKGFGDFIRNNRIEEVYPIVNEIPFNSKISFSVDIFNGDFITHYLKKRNIIYKLFYPDRTVYKIEKILTGPTNTTGPRIEFIYGL